MTIEYIEPTTPKSPYPKLYDTETKTTQYIDSHGNVLTVISPSYISTDDPGVGQALYQHNYRGPGDWEEYVQ